MAGKSNNGKRNGTKASKGANGHAKPPEANGTNQGATAGGSGPGDNSSSQLHSGATGNAAPQVAFEAFPTPSPRSTGVGTIVYRRAFASRVQAAQSCFGLPADDLMRVLGECCSDDLKAPMLTIANKLTHEERAFLVAFSAWSFHGGYSVCLDHVENNRNLHAEYANESARHPAAPAR